MMDRRTIQAVTLQGIASDIAQLLMKTNSMGLRVIQERQRGNVDDDTYGEYHRSMDDVRERLQLLHKLLAHRQEMLLK